jgi:hypothetical protein
LFGGDRGLTIDTSIETSIGEIVLGSLGVVVFAVISLGDILDDLDLIVDRLKLVVLILGDQSQFIPLADTVDAVGASFFAHGLLLLFLLIIIIVITLFITLFLFSLSFFHQLSPGPAFLAATGAQDSLPLGLIVSVDRDELVLAGDAALIVEGDLAFELLNLVTLEMRLLYL